MINGEWTFVEGIFENGVFYDGIWNNGVFTYSNGAVSAVSFAHAFNEGAMQGQIFEGQMGDHIINFGEGGNFQMGQIIHGETDWSNMVHHISAKENDDSEEASAEGSAEASGDEEES